MGSIIIDDPLVNDPSLLSSFEVLDDAHPKDTSLPAFMVSKTRGFLPRAEPVVELPAVFAPLEDLLTRMPVKRLDGTPGLLAEGKLGDAILKDGLLPDLTDAIDEPEVRHNLPLLNALYRDYAFLASAFLLEPCHLRFLKGEPYGLGRDVLPACIARPIARTARICGFKPFMEYAGSYALFNYRLEDPSKGLQYDNLRLIRAFEHGLDPTSSEAGFVLVHVDMVRNSGPLVAGTCDCLDVVEDHKPRAEFNAGLAQVVGALTRINGVMETMWAKSRPEQYTSFRTFIFGITSQSMFPDGVAYEGVGEDGFEAASPATKTRLSFRGESGANDSMVPLMDSFLQIPMPDTPLTEILKDFRQYRPSNHRQFLAYVRARSTQLGVKAFALGDGGGEENEKIESVRLWLQILNQVRDFRWRHWCFGKEYILKRTKHPTATGGSPIVTWLPNQLKAVLLEMQAIYAGAVGEEAAAHAGTVKTKLGEDIDDMMDMVGRQSATLAKEVARYCEERGV
ncbi:hypothetical protein SBRCBS47491_009603 [Sporothrix bragantina]|uniref:Indoleamine 2,3-dioxygenase n=1 Tax=Sporothrix bragantina TaxID=671064 RepID=A0ABP0CW18_9PEZI